MALPTMHGQFNVGGDPELKFLPSGQPVANFSIIANSAKKLDNGEWETTGETGWIRVNAWGSMAERVANDVSKGARVYIIGRFKVRKFTNREGVEVSSMELDADAVEVLPDRRNTEAKPAADPWASPAASGGQPSTDEPPF